MSNSYIITQAIDAVWKTLPIPPVASLANARLRLHWGSQIPCAAASQLIKPLPDYSQGSLSYHQGLHAMLTRPLASHKGLQAGLNITECSLLLVDKKSQPIAKQPLVGLTLKEGMVWMAEALEKHGGKAVPELVRPFEEIPDSPVAHGEPFPDNEPAALAEIDLWFANSYAVLALLAKSLKSSTVWCWPHHFDVATLLLLEDKNSEEAKQVNIGLSPGDDNFETPYWYITFWPDSSQPLLPLEGQGFWYQEKFKGALLTTDNLASTGQPEQVAAYLNSAIKACLKLLD